ncbi:MAG: FadR family transcriptional regulator [Candidatus Marinimicrobia bacterium]|nr:FadR family transcriptional regulator [Candidatus Neomarinimicrobiota bacterium]
MFEFKKVGDKSKLSQKIVRQIEGAIRKKEIGPGDKIPTEKELCEIFDVSRTAVREAIQKLDAKGLIRIKKGSGIYVNEYLAGNVIDSMELYLELNLNKDYIIHVINIREILEPEIARLSAKNRSKEDLMAIGETIQELKKCDSKDFKKEGEIDKQFHMNIAKSCGNPLVMLMLKPVFKLMPKVRSIVYKDLDQAKPDALEYHKEIFAMIKNKDEVGAYESMSNHLQIAEKHSKIIMELL